MTTEWKRLEFGREVSAVAVLLGAAAGEVFPVT